MRIGLGLESLLLGSRAGGGTGRQELGRIVERQESVNGEEGKKVGRCFSVATGCFISEKESVFQRQLRSSHVLPFDP